MFGSLKSKMFMLVAGILILVAFFVLFFTKRDVERAMRDSENRSVENVMRLAELTVRGGYKSLMLEKIASVKARKEQLSAMMSVILEGLVRLQTMADEERLTRGEAQSAFLTWMNDAAKEYTFLVYGKDLKVISPDPNKHGASLSSMKDLKGQSVAQALRDKAIKDGQAFATYQETLRSGTEVQRLGLFAYDPTWDWIVVAALDMVDLEEDYANKVQEMVDVLNTNLPKIRIAESGYVFMFDGQGKVLVDPTEGKAKLETVVNQLTGRPLLTELMEQGQAKEPQPLLFDDGDMESGKGPSRVAVTYIKPLDWYIASMASLSEIHAPAAKVVTRQTQIIAAIFLLSLILALAFVTRITRPLTRLTDHVRTLSKQDFSQPQESDSSIEDLTKSHRDEVGRLAEAFVFMEDSLRENVKNLMDTTAAKQAIESELSIAHDIQMGLLPKIFPPFPDRKELDLYAMIEPAKEVGGDLYDFFFLDDSRLCFTVGDVSDKGVPAAMFMAVTKTLIKARAEKGLSPAEMMVGVNNDLSEDNPNTMFVTLIIGVLDLVTGEIDYACGGHNPPVFLPKNGEPTYLKGVSGPMLGAMEDMAFTPLATKLEPGDALLLYTDGVTEAMDAKKELFSEERLLEALDDYKGRPMRDIVDTVLERIRVHVKGEPPSDDITMLCIRFHGPASKD